MEGELIEIHSIFEPLYKNFRYFFVSMNMMAIPILQNLLISSQPDLEKMSALQLSIKVGEFNTLFYSTKKSIEEFNHDTNLRRLDNGQVKCDINNLLIHFSKNIFSYQVAVVVKPKPTLRLLLKNSHKASEIKRKMFDL